MYRNVNSSLRLSNGYFEAYSYEYDLVWGSRRPWAQTHAPGMEYSLRELRGLQTVKGFSGRAVLRSRRPAFRSCLGDPVKLKLLHLLDSNGCFSLDLQELICLLYLIYIVA